VLALPRQFLAFSGSEAFAWVWQEGKAVKQQLSYRTVADRWVIAENLREGSVILSPSGEDYLIDQMGKEQVREKLEHLACTIGDEPC
jgi:hypothetical protein